MTSKRGIILLFFLIALVGGVVWLTWFSRPPEPRVKGVPTSRWLATIRYGDFKKQDELAEVGPDAIPHLLKALKRHETISLQEFCQT